MNKFEIEIPVKSRYFTHGKLSSSTKHIWIVCHGYGQLAEYFIKKFETLNPEKHFVIAPEGMNRFYLQGFSGRVGATWMTKEDRETDIENYCHQLNAILNSIGKEHLNQAKLNLFGFSQGTATITRWMEREQVKCDNLILWAGRVAHELNLSRFHNHFKAGYFLIGEEDEFYSVDQVESYSSEIAKQGLEMAFQSYPGKHSVDAQVLLQLSAKL